MKNPFKRSGAKKSWSPRQTVQSFLSSKAFRITIFAFLGIAVLATITASYLWYFRLYLTPERRFYMAVENAMQLPSVTRTLTEGGTGNQVVQDYRFHYSPLRVIENAVEYTEKSATVDTFVRTEGVVYPGEQYLRYSQFRTNQGENVAANIDPLIGKWAYEAARDEEQSRLDYLSEQVTLVIFGNFPTAFKQELLRDIQNQQVYGDNFTTITDEIDGERVNTYTVTVKLRAYAELLQRSFQRMGYGDFPALDPANYGEDVTVNAVMSVRSRDNVFVKVAFGGREESYSNHGVVKDIDQPDADLTIEQIQQKVQASFEN